MAESSPQPTHYRGRFAPSPTGPLHFGSLVAATGSFLDARSQGGEWLVRIDDIDPPREVPGSAKSILDTLSRFGFEWDGPVSYQSQRHGLYRDAIDNLRHSGLVYPCGCSRKEIAAAQNHMQQVGNIYPGTCRNGLPAGKRGRMWRVNTANSAIEFNDGVFGPCHYELEQVSGDFVILRADGFYSYQLATAFDDAEQGITHVVRGCDLLDSTARQIFLQQALRLAVPRYTHLPLAVTTAGQKLSKQSQSPALYTQALGSQLCTAFTFLGLNPPATLQHESLISIWDWAIPAWHLHKIPREKHILFDI